MLDYPFWYVLREMTTEPVKGLYITKLLQKHCCCFHGVSTKLKNLLIERKNYSQLEIWVLTLYNVMNGYDKTYHDFTIEHAKCLQIRKLEKQVVQEEYKVYPTKKSMGISCVKALLQISSFRVNFGVTAFKHSKGPTYSQIQLDIHTDPTMPPQYMTNLKKDTKLTSAILEMSPNFACHSPESLYRLSHSL